MEMNYSSVSRVHTKSRNGCTTCKARRVKCDETHPTCLSCRRRGTECSYIKPSAIRRHRQKKDRQDSNLTVNDQPYTHQGEKQTRVEDVQTLFYSPQSWDVETLDFPNAPELSFELGDFAGLIQQQNNEYDIRSYELPELDYFGKSPQQRNPGGDIRVKSYVSSTATNLKLARYWTEIYHHKLSPARDDFKEGWKSAMMLGYKEESVYHIIMADVIMDLYYKCLNNPQYEEKIFNFENLNDYLRMAGVNYNEYKKCTPVSKFADDYLNKNNSLTIFVDSILEMLYFMLSPSLSIFDPQFYKLAQTSNEVFDLAAEAFSKDKVRSSALDYYSPASSLETVPNSDIYFPNYLYQLSHVPGRYSVVKQSDTMFQRESIKESEHILDAIDALKNEYQSVSNDKIKKDPFRTFLRFPALLSVEFVEMLSRQDQRCLIVMAHYLMLLQSLSPNKLIPHRCITCQLQNLHTVMDEQWMSWLDVPKRVVGLL